MRNLGRTLLTFNANESTIIRGNLWNPKSSHHKETGKANQLKGLPPGLQNRDTFRTWWNFYANGQKPISVDQQIRSRAANRNFTDYLRNEKASKFLKIFTAIEPEINDADQIYDGFMCCFHKPKHKKKKRQLTRSKAIKTEIPIISDISYRQTQTESSHEEHQIGRLPLSENRWKSADDQFTEDLFNFGNGQEHTRQLVYNEKKTMSADDKFSYNTPEFSQDQPDKISKYSKKSRKYSSNSSLIVDEEKTTDILRELTKPNGDTKVTNSNTIPLSTNPYESVPQIYKKWIQSYNKAHKRPKKFVSPRRRSKRNSPYENMPQSKRRKLKTYKNAHDEKSKIQHSDAVKHYNSYNSKKLRETPSSSINNFITDEQKSKETVLKLTNLIEEIDKVEEQNKIDVNDDKEYSKIERKNISPNEMNKLKLRLKKWKSYKKDTPIKSKIEAETTRPEPRTSEGSTPRLSRLTAPRISDINTSRSSIIAAPPSSRIVTDEADTASLKVDLNNATEQIGKKKPSNATLRGERLMSIRHYYTKFLSKPVASPRQRYNSILEAAEQVLMAEQHLFEVRRYTNAMATATLKANAEAEAETGPEIQNAEIIIDKKLKKSITKRTSKSKTRKSLGLFDSDSDASISAMHLMKLKKFQRMARAAEKHKGLMPVRYQSLTRHSIKLLPKHNTHLDHRRIGSEIESPKADTGHHRVDRPEISDNPNVNVKEIITETPKKKAVFELYGKSYSSISLNTHPSQLSTVSPATSIDIEAHITNFMKVHKITWDMFKQLPHNWPCPYESNIIQRMRNEWSMKDQPNSNKKNAKMLATKTKRKKKIKNNNNKNIQKPEAIKPTPIKAVSCDICRGLKMTLPEAPYMLEMRKRMERDELLHIYKYHLRTSSSQANQGNRSFASSGSTQNPIHFNCQTKWRAKQTLTQKLIACYQVLSECQKRLDNKLLQLQCDELQACPVLCLNQFKCNEMN